MPVSASLDHLVLTVADPARTEAFRESVLGMRAESVAADDGTARRALFFGAHKINLHPAARPFEPKARAQMPGSADPCCLSLTALPDWQAHLDRLGVAVELGPLARTGAIGTDRSIYLHDPAGDLIEIATVAPGGRAR